MQRKLVLKLIAIAVLSLLLLVPLGMIEQQVRERSARQAEVVRNIAESAAGPQTLVGPVLAIRYRERIEHREKDAKTGAETVRHEIVERTRLLPPQKLDIAGGSRVEMRNRGLYGARLYHLDLQFAGRALVPPRLGLDGATAIVDANAFLVLGLSDPRGVGVDPDVRIDGESRRFATGTLGLIAGAGLHIPLGKVGVSDLAEGRRVEFAFPLKLTGLEHLRIAPTGETTTVALKSDWPHPSFQGRFLPTTRSVDKNGFEARWEVSHLARNFDRIAKGGAEHAAHGETLGVSYMDPVNVYLKSERAVKYGVLFVVLVFAAFFLTEALRHLPIHPLQYLLVGLALAVFFLLLIALSEHTDFGLAYAASAAASTLLIGAYLAGALRDRRRGIGFGAGIATLYGVLYGVLLSEDNALLMGSLLIFSALGATMLATRRIDWYSVGTGGSDEAMANEGGRA
jgi:inner membrane protein